MNKLYQLVFNHQLGVVQVASELATPSSAGSAGVVGSRFAGRHAIAALAVAIAVAMAPQIALAQSHTDYTADTTINAQTGHVWDNSNVFVGYHNGEIVDIHITGNGRLASVSSTNSVTYGDMFIGTMDGTTASVTVQGANASLYAQDDIQIGRSGATGTSKGTLLVQQGAVASTLSSDPAYDDSRSSLSINRNGLAIVEDAGSKLETATLNVVAGGSDPAVQTGLIVRNGGVVHSTDAVVSPVSSRDVASVQVDGAGSAWANSDSLSVAGLEIRSGGVVSTGTLDVLGSNGFHNNGIRVDGAASRLTASGVTTVHDRGVISLANGAQFSNGGQAITLGTSSTLLNNGTTGGIAIGGGVSLSIGGLEGWKRTQADVATGAGTIDPNAVITFTEDRNANASLIAFNHTDTNYVFSNKLVSADLRAGRLMSFAGTTTVNGILDDFSGGAAAAGGTLVLASNIGGNAGWNETSLRPADYIAYNGGRLVVDAIAKGYRAVVSTDGTSTMGSAATGQGGILAGSGTLDLVKGLYAYDGGRIAPGNGSVGTLKINGDLYMGLDELGGNGGDAGAGIAPRTVFYDVDIRGNGSSDLLQVSGKTTIGLASDGQTANGAPVAVKVTALDGAASYQDGQQYTILSSTGGVFGQFSGVSTDSAFLTTSLSYAPTSVSLRIGLIDTGFPDLAVNGGTTYTGTGNVGAVKVLSGGIFSPGGSAIGALNSDGNITFDAGSTYAVDIKGDGSSDKLTTTGAITLNGGSVKVTALDAKTSYQNGQSYSILEGAGGLTGTFAGSTTDSAFLTTSLVYTANGAQLKIGLLDTGLQDVNVASGSTFTGVGNVGKVHVLGGGILSPSGSGVGTLTSNGAIQFDANSIYAVDVKGDGTSDKLTTTGAISIGGGTVQVTALDASSSYQNGQSYEILSGDGGITGTFAGTTSKSAFLSSTLDYGTANKVKLKIQITGTGGGGGTGPNPAPQIFQTVAKTSNQYNTAVALNGLPQSGAALALYNQLLLLNAANARTAFEKLSGEAHSGVRSVLMGDQAYRDTVQGHLDFAAEQERGSGGFWLAGLGRQVRLDGDGNAAAVRSQRHGGLGGVEGFMGENWLLGFAAGIQDGEVEVDGVSSKADVRSVSYGPYLQAQWGRARLQGGVEVVDHKIDTTRTVYIGTVLPQTLRGSHDAKASTAYVRGAFDLQTGMEGLTVSPTVSLAYTQLESDAFTESGGAAALAMAKRVDDYFVGRIGVRGNWNIAGEGMSGGWRISGGLGWQYAEGDLTAVSHQRFAVGTDAFEVEGPGLPRSSGVLDFGVARRTSRNADLSLSVKLQEGGQAHGVGANLQWHVNL